MSGSPKKATDEQLITSYRSLGSCKKVADQYGMCAQSVHERLQRLEASNSPNHFSDKEAIYLAAKYNVYVDQGRLDELANRMGRTRQFLCRKAKELGLTDKRRRKSISATRQLSARSREWHEYNPHPRGMKGKHHSPTAREKMSEHSQKVWNSRTQDERDNHILNARKARKAGPVERNGATWKSGWRDVGGRQIYFRSRWEANYGRYLEWLRERGEIWEWEHEPETFWFEGIRRGCVSYLPDFRVTEASGARTYYEVKGWMDQRSRTKLKRMAKYHPKVDLVLIDAKQYRKLDRQLRGLIPGWEWGKS